MIKVYEIVPENLVTPGHKIWQPQNIKMSAQFQATSRFDNEYIRNTTIYRQPENGFENTITPNMTVHTFRRPVHLSKFSYLGEERECKTNPAGNGYVGTSSVTASSHSCISWTAVQSDEILASLAVDDIAKVKNYCRKLAGSKRKDPSCVISAKQMQLEQPCNINFCGKCFRQADVQIC